jgi:hypothetical protein
MKHKCHAVDCEVQVSPRLLMCLKHWRLVRPDVQREAWRLYRPGQEIDKKPSLGYLAIHHIAVACVADREGKKDAFQEHAKIAERYIEMAGKA